MQFVPIAFPFGSSHPGAPEKMMRKDKADVCDTELVQANDVIIIADDRSGCALQQLSWRAMGVATLHSERRAYSQKGPMTRNVGTATSVNPMAGLAHGGGRVVRPAAGIMPSFPSQVVTQWAQQCDRNGGMQIACGATIGQEEQQAQEGHAQMRQLCLWPLRLREEMPHLPGMDL